MKKVCSRQQVAKRTQSNEAINALPRPATSSLTDKSMRVFIKVDQFGILELSQLSAMLDIEKVAFYSFRKNKNKTITLRLYDSKRKLIRHYGSKAK